MNRVKFLFILLLFHASNILGEMKTYEFFVELFPQEAVPTEYNAYLLLKKRPLSGNINYLAIPWTVLINTDKLGKIPAIKIQGGFTICQHINFEKIIPFLKKIGIDTLFTPHAVKKVEKINGITILPFPHYPINGIEPAESKNIFYSFIGFETHEIRKKIFEAKHPKNTVIKKRKNWHFWQSSSQKIKEKKEYQDVLAHSRFSLCPRGTGPSTIRFWESLQSGAIPVLFDDDLILPDCFEWKNCTVQLTRKDVTKIASLLKLINNDTEKKLRETCLKAYRVFCNKNLIKFIIHHYEHQGSESSMGFCSLCDDENSSRLTTAL